MKSLRPVLLILGLCCAPALAGEPFHYEVKEGLNLNDFLRDGPVSAHMLLRSGRDPRFLAVFPAGNSGAGLWFEPVEGTPQWVLDSPPLPQTMQDALGRPLYGFSAEASLKTPALTPKQAVLSSVRFLRGYQGKAPIPDEILVAPIRDGNRLTWARDRLDGAAGYRLTLEVTDGTLTPDGHILAGTDGRIALKFTAFSGETPLTPLSGTDLLKADAAPDPAARNALTFLSYREKFLAGSWRFDTYFGRDTLMSTRLLLPVLSPEAAEAALGAVVARLNGEGEVAHEEAIGEFAVADHLQHDGTRNDTPINDYGMVDGNYMLAPVAAAYLLDNDQGKLRAADFLARDGAGAALVRNLDDVVSTTAAFARQPGWRHLVRFKPGRLTGQWRDSEEGNGRGVYPYDVNAVFVPAALDAIARLMDSRLLDPYLDAAGRDRLAKAAAAAKVWRERAPGLYEMAISAGPARDGIKRYAASQGISPAAALAALKGSKEVRFHALSLDEAGNKVPVIHSDESFALLFGNPSPDSLDRMVETLTRPFPLGLMTDAGLLVANPVFANDAMQARFSRNAYHGTVVWSWQQALLAAGLKRQLARADLPGPVRQHLKAAQATLWHAIEATRSLSNSELWTWRPENGRIVAAPFGANAGDEDESNAAQLWSTVYLAVRPD